jgi:hypothetical protein
MNKKFIITESEKKEILNLYFPNIINEKNEVSRWEPVNVNINQRVTILDPSKFNNTVVFENMGIILTIVEVNGDVITASAELPQPGDVSRVSHEIRLQRLLKVKGPQWSNMVKFKVDLSSAKEYQYTKLLNNKSLLNSLKSSSVIGQKGSIDFLTKNVSDENTSKIEFRNFPNKENPLSGSLPAGTVTITHWWFDSNYSGGDYSYPGVNDEYEKSKEEKVRDRGIRKQYRKQYKEYKKSQKETEPEVSFTQLKDTGNLRDALKALKGKIFKTNKLFVINNAEIKDKQILTLNCSKQTTNTDLNDAEFGGGDVEMYFKCGKPFLYDSSGYTFKSVSYGDTAQEQPNDLITDLQDYVCEYL